MACRSFAGSARTDELLFGTESEPLARTPVRIEDHHLVRLKTQYDRRELYKRAYSGQIQANTACLRAYQEAEVVQLRILETVDHGHSRLAAELPSEGVKGECNFRQPLT